MKRAQSSLENSTPEEIAFTKRWVETWRLAGEELERIHRQELRALDNYQAIQLLLGHFDYSKPPRAPKPWSGLIEQQRLFMRMAGRECPSFLERNLQVPEDQR